MDERSIFMAAVERESPPERSAYLDEACGGDTALRQRVDALLASHEQAGSFLRMPAPERLAEKVRAPAPLEGTGAGLPATQEPPGALPEGPGGRIGPYKLLQEIGEGGMGTVFLAEQSEPVRRLVALKIIKPGMDSRQVIARFEAERQALALMDHPNIARVLDGGTTGGEPGGVSPGRPYFVMELVKGIPITRFCDEQRLTPRQRLELFVPVCQAVQHAHQKGIIHRDLKPSNVLICLYDGRPVPKVIDFGVAKATGQKLTERTMFTEVGQVVGTLEYMSPEQAELNQLDIDTRSDIYSLGVLLYELLTGSTPLDKKRLTSAAMLEVLRLIREEEPPRPSTRLSDSKDTLPSISAQRQMEPARLAKLVRGELDWIVMKALEKDRNRRYETANGFAADIQRYLADEPVLACPPSGWYRWRKFVRRNRRGLSTVAGVLLVLLLSAGGLGWVLWEQAARRVTTERTVTAALASAGQLAAEARKRPIATSGQAEAALVLWRQAQDAVAQADAALTTGADDDVLRQQTAALHAQLEEGRRQTEERRIRALRKERLFRDLEEARLARSIWLDDHWDWATAATKYAAAFTAYDLDVTANPHDEAVRRIAAEEPAVRDALIVALMDWGFAAAQEKRSMPLATDLFRFARTADASGWQKRFRDAAGKHDRQALRALSVEARRSALPVSSLVLLAGHLSFEGEHEESLALLRWGRGRYASDFWLHFELGKRLHTKRETPTALELEEAIGCYRAALALRPETHAVHYNLGAALRAKGELDEAIAAYREAIRLKKDDAQAHGSLGRALRGKGLVDDAIAAYQEAIRLNKHDPQFHYGLGNTLRVKGHVLEAIAEFQEAIRLKRDYPEAHHDLATALLDKLRLDDAMVEYREAARHKKDWAMPHFGLGIIFYRRGLLAEAIGEFREAIRLKEDYHEAHTMLGIVLMKRGQLDDAIAEFREVIRLRKDYAKAHNNLGTALKEKGQADDAIACFRKAVELDPHLAMAQTNLGNALKDKGQVDDAIVCYRKVIAIAPKDAIAHYNLGSASLDKGQMEKAIACLRRAIELAPKHAEAHCNLGHALRQQGRFREALEELRRGHELGSPSPRWPYSSAAWVRQCERLIELDDKLADILAGKTTPASPGERIELAGVCSIKRLNGAAARFYEEAFAAEPKLANDPAVPNRYNAACAAALAGCGHGHDPDKLDAVERAGLRHQALAWLQADLEAWRRLLGQQPDRLRPIVAKQMRYWLADTDFAGVRGQAAIARLPQAEQPAWRQLWSDVSNTLAEIQAKMPAKTKSN